MDGLVSLGLSAETVPLQPKLADRWGLLDHRPQKQRVVPIRAESLLRRSAVYATFCSVMWGKFEHLSQVRVDNRSNR